jgi:hypothetical protein
LDYPNSSRQLDTNENDDDDDDDDDDHDDDDDGFFFCFFFFKQQKTKPQQYIKDKNKTTTTTFTFTKHLSTTKVNSTLKITQEFPTLVKQNTKKHGSFSHYCTFLTLSSL